ncbi:MAG: D-alanyl-D-alanine carboxypeptidase/D-alanyl-D-alanine-endopeptidase [Verrucomicrobia bacterium]|nr:MAG: D-alanyl-D-alanine carboxypeptidase/D-alanyl-D-alanine-endopeptidase [Verrucomicrobiota bacterium]
MKLKKLFCLATMMLALAGKAVFAQSTNAPTSLAELQQRLTEQVSSPRFDSAIFGVKIVSLDTGKTLFEHNANKLLSPASNCKLYTVALALDQLGGDYRIRTSLYAVGKTNRAGTLKGDLIVYGRGATDFNARWHGDDIYRAFESLVAVLTNAGIKRITGDLIGDDSFFRGPPTGSGWDCDDLQCYYGAELSALTVNDNVLTFVAKPSAKVGEPCELSLKPATSYLALSNRTVTGAADTKGSITLYRPLGENLVYATGQWPAGGGQHTDYVTMHNPAGLFVSFFKEALARHGIKVGGKTRSINSVARGAKPLASGKLIELGSVESLPLRDLAREIQKPSQNLYTDLLLCHLGALAQAKLAETTDPLTPSLSPSDGERAAGRPGEGRSQTIGAHSAPWNMTETSEEAGIRQLKKFLAHVGIGTNDVHLEEGSGLSRNNMVTPNATIALLQYMSLSPEAEAYLNSLPIAGVDGSLKNRMKNTAAAGNVRAKTGTLRWANSLSGHVKTAAGERLIFSLMLNRYVAPDDEHPARGELDKIAVTLAEFAGRSEQ